jgi:hypothetical protein
MTTAKKTYVVQRRYWVWAERKVVAGSMEEACTLLSSLNQTNFVRAAPGAELLDSEIMSGDAVREDW